MKLILAILMTASFQVAAMDAIPNVPTQFPNESGWALAMISMACDADVSKVEGVRGTIQKSNNGVVYKALVGQKVILAAKAKYDLIGTAVCLD